MAVGALAWVSPPLAARVFGLDPENKQPIVSQLFGARDFALGYLTATSTGNTRRQVLRMGVVLDSADTVASLVQIRRGTMSTQAMLLVGAGAATFATLGAVALASDETEGA